MTMTPYYNRIAKKWHDVTSAQGGALKRMQLNDLVIDRLTGIASCSILELGAGNGYFLPLVFRRFSGQTPARVVVTDQSPILLSLAQRSFRVAEAEYRVLDVRDPFPFADGAFDLIVANMMLNELPTAVLLNALNECRRVLSVEGRLLATIAHPDFVESLARRGELKPLAGRLQTMPGTDGLRLPVVRRRLDEYRSQFKEAGFRSDFEEIHPSEQVLKAKPGLRKAGRVAIAVFIDCRRADSLA